MKKIYYCKNLFDNIIINNEKIKIPHCALSDTNCALNAHKTFHTYEEYLNHFFNRKKGAIKQLFLGKKPIKCEYCSKLESQEINIIDYLKIKFQKNFITSISIFLKKKEENKNPSFEKLLKYLIQKNMIKKEKTVIEFFEYNIESWDEIKDVIETSYKYGIKKYTYTTNAEIFIPEIAEYGKDTNSTIIIPLNAGCRETYQKTNNSDKFDDVIENIVKYNKSNITCVLKYTIIADLNDNLDEIKKFCNTISGILKKADSTGGFSIFFDIDEEKIKDMDYLMPQNYKELINYIDGWGEYKHIDVFIQDQVRKLCEEK